MTIIRRGALPKRNYTVLDNGTINDTSLDYRALGLLTYLLSKPENWKVNAIALSQSEGREGRDAVRKSLGKLEKAGYLVRIKRRNKCGQYTTECIIYDRPVDKNEVKAQVRPETEKPHRETRSGKSDAGKSVANTNTVNVNNLLGDSHNLVSDCSICDENSGWYTVNDLAVRCPNRCSAPSPRTLIPPSQNPYGDRQRPNSDGSNDNCNNKRNRSKTSTEDRKAKKELVRASRSVLMPSLAT